MRPQHRARLEQEAARRDAHRLAAVARDCESAGIGRNCLLLRLSSLPPDLRRPHHLRLAREALDPLLLSADRAQRFSLPNDDVVVVWRGPAADALDASRRALVKMFDDADAEMPPVDQLWREMDLPAHGDHVLALVGECLSPARLPALAAMPLQALDAAALASLETVLAHADLARFARRRPVCRRASDGRFQIEWELRTLSVDDLCAELTPGRHPKTTPWLFRRLLRTVERRQLALLAAAEELRAAGPFGIDLTVASILAPEFLRFDAALPQRLRGRVTLGVQPEDIVDDLSAFRFARDFARLRGYRLLLRLPDCGLLPAMPPARLGLDLVEIAWSRRAVELPTDLLDDEAGRAVLTGADSAEALAWARSFNIALFEGRAVAPGRPAATALPAAK